MAGGGCFSRASTSLPRRSAAPVLTPDCCAALPPGGAGCCCDGAASVIGGAALLSCCTALTVALGGCAATSARASDPSTLDTAQCYSTQSCSKCAAPHARLTCRRVRRQYGNRHCCRAAEQRCTWMHRHANGWSSRQSRLMRLYAISTLRSLSRTHQQGSQRAAGQYRSAPGSCVHASNGTAGSAACVALCARLS